ncbi:stomatin-like isoform 2-T2 [Liasis olivaceus]
MGCINGPQEAGSIFKAVFLQMQEGIRVGIRLGKAQLLRFLLASFPDNSKQKGLQQAKPGDFDLGFILRGWLWKPNLFAFVLGQYSAQSQEMDTLIKVDMRTKTFDMPFQEIFTKDPLIIDVDGVVYYRVQNAPLAVTKVTNADSATHLLAKAIMKNTLGAQNLCHIISERDKVAKDIQALLDNVTGDWGVKIERVEIKNVKTRVNVVAPRNMMPQPKPVKEASILLQESPLSLQLHYLKADGAHSGQPNSTIIFSYP